MAVWAEIIITKDFEIGNVLLKFGNMLPIFFGRGGRFFDFI